MRKVSIKGQFKRKVVDERRIRKTIVTGEPGQYPRLRDLDHVLLVGECSHEVERQKRRDGENHRFFYCELCADLKGVAL